MLGRDEFEGLGPVSGPFEEKRPEGVGRELGLALPPDPVPQGGRQDRRGLELGAELLLAAGGDDEEGRPGGDPAGKRVVGRRVAGVEGDKDIDPVERGVGDGARRERQPLVQASSRAIRLQSSTSSGRASIPRIRAPPPRTEARAKVR